MQIEAISRTQAEQIIFPDDTLIISISNIDQSTPKINANNILLLHFDDEEKPHANAMTELDAKKIVDIVKLHKNKINEIIVHCGAGVSRSAGVAAALGKWLNGDDGFIFNNFKYCPNFTCYRLVLNEALGSTDEKNLEELFTKNIKGWVKENVK